MLNARMHTISTAAVPLEMASRSGTTPSELIFQICTASVSAGRNTFHGHEVLVRSKLVKSSTGADCPAVKISAAASPNTRPAESTTPVTMAGMAAGSSTWMVVSQRVSPMASPASRWLRGTSSSAC